MKDEMKEVEFLNELSQDIVDFSNECFEKYGDINNRMFIGGLISHFMCMAFKSAPSISEAKELFEQCFQMAYEASYKHDDE